jgi:hypothetical protein
MNGFLELVAEAGPGVAIRATVLFVVASLVSLVMARASAAQRHAIHHGCIRSALRTEYSEVA